MPAPTYIINSKAKVIQYLSTLKLQLSNAVEEIGSSLAKNIKLSLQFKNKLEHN